MTQNNQIPVQVKVVGELAKLQKENPDKFLSFLPYYASKHSAGLDLRVASNTKIVIQPNETVVVGTGLALYLADPNLVGFVFPRSGRGSKGLVLGNLTGVIDSDYQGELQITLWNRTNHVQEIEPWERVAQYVIVPKLSAQLNIVDEFNIETERGTGGYGSTGQL
jgi:dUTP pyrophosphatase